jgi:hypothetical protein
MTDLATLGLAIDSGPVVRARDELGRFVGAAKSAQQAAAGLEGQAAGVSAGMAGAGAAATTAAGALSKAGQAAGQAGAGFQVAGAGAGQLVPPLTKLPPLARQSTLQLQMLSYQLNDVATMGLSGASAFQILATQGGQFFQVLQMGEGGARGSLARMTAGLMGLVTPANVALAGVAALGAGFLAYSAISRETLPSLDETLKEHADLIGRIKTAYGEAAIAADTYGRESRTVFDAGLQGQIRDFQDQLKAATDDFYNSVTYQQARSRSGMGPRVVTGEFAPFADEIEALRKSAAAGEADVRGFRQAIAEAIKAEPADSELRKLGESLLDSTDKLAQIDGKLDQTRGTLSNMGAAASGAAGGISTLSKSLSELVGLATPAETIFDKIDRLTRESISASPGVGGIQAALAARQEALRRVADENMPVPRPRPNLLGEVSPYESALTSARDQLRQAGDALLIYDKGAAAIEAYRMQETILQAAQKEGMTLTADQMAGVEALTGAYTKLLQERDKLKISADLNFERDQLGRSPTDQRVATTLRGIYGDNYGSQMNAGLANQIRQNEALKEMSAAAEKARKSMMDFQRDTTKGFLSDLYSGLREGKNGFDALADAATNAADKIANRLMDKATDSIVNALFPDTSKTGGKAGGGGYSDIAQSILDAIKPTPGSARVGGIGSDAVAGGKITGLNDNFRSGLGQMIEDAKAAGFDIDVNSGFRSVERQQELWDAALKKYGSPEAARKWVAPPGRSMHNYGMAADLGYNTPGAADWAHQNAGKYGLNFPLSNENWHVEPIGARAEAAGRSLQSMAEAAKGTAQATAGLGNGFGDLSQRVAQAFQGLGGGGGVAEIGNILSGIGGSNWSSNLIASVTPGATGWLNAKGNAFSGGNIIPFANGGVFDKATVFPMAKGNIGVMGEAGPEAVMPLRRLGNGRLGVEAVKAIQPAMPPVAAPAVQTGGKPVSGNMNVTIVNNAGVAVRTEERTNPSGERELVAVIDEQVAKAASRRGGQTDRLLSARGARPAMRKLG